MEERSHGLNLNEFSTADHDFFSNNYYSDETDNELLIITVELAEGKKDQLVVHENDNLEHIAQEFCDKNELGPKSKEYLIEEIEKNIQTLYPQPLSRLAESIEQVLHEEVSVEPENKGCELYLKGMKMKQKVENKNQAYRSQREEKEMQGSTFKPRTNYAGRRQKPPEQILLEKGRQTVETIEKKKIEIENKIMSNCTFSPEINKNSGKMKKSVLRSPERFKFLYQDAQNIHEKIIRKSQEL